MRRRIVAIAAAVLLASGCGDAAARPDVIPEQPVPRCIELETKMVECARAAAGVPHLGESVERGLRDAAGINCRRMRSASHDPELPARIVAACASESCADFAECMAQAAEREGLVALTERPATGGGGRTGGGTIGAPPRDAGAAPPDAGTTGTYGTEGYGAGSYGTEGYGTEGYGAEGYGAEGYGAGGYGYEPMEADLSLVCEAFVDKMLGCAEEAAGGPLAANELEEASLAFGDVCVQLGNLASGSLEAVFSGCAAATCGDYVPCVTKRLGEGGE
ncbi:MAG: hypothetical protein HY905_19805 [Deltaproteobacteria bacterium]|nr:hypothetical protein [Deltaproteobacteria bacterium]